MRKLKSQRLFQSLRSLRPKSRRGLDKSHAAKSTTRIVLLDTHDVAPLHRDEGDEMIQSSQRNIDPCDKEPEWFVRCPLGLEAGNTVMVISPCGTHKFPVKIPKGIVCGQEFPVQLPCEQEESRSKQDNDAPREESSLGYVFRVVDEFLTPTPSFEEDEQQSHPASEKEAQTKMNETKVIMSEDFTTILDSFFTPVPEVKAFFHAATA